MDREYSDAEHANQAPVPGHLADTHYKGAAKLKKGEGYKYPHDYQNHYVPQQYLPDDLVGPVYYEPSDQGGEKEIRERRRSREKQP